ncbi:MAG: class I SAM-dependent methyltransferase [Bacteroidota bacterium]
MPNTKKKTIKYSFDYLDECNMCNSTKEYHKILGKRLNQSQGKNPRNKIGITTTIIRCKKCQLIFSNPQPIPESIEDHYGVPPESYWKEKNYFSTDDNYFQNEIDKLKKIFEIKPGMKALDIGAGIGKSMITLDKAGFDSYGFEPSEDFRKMAISKMGISEEKLRLGQIETIEYDENSFDFISFGAVLEHLYNPSDSLIKAIKWLKPGGLIYIEVPSSNWLTSKFFNLYFKIIGTDYVSNISPMHEPYHLFEFSLKSFIEHSKVNNYQIAHYEYFVGETYLPRILNPIVIPYMKWTNSGMQFCIWLKK